MKKQLLLFIILIPLHMGCKEENRGPLTDDSHIPEQVDNIQVENLPGGATISYSLPKDPQVSHVLAVYTLKNEKQKEAVSSVFKNHIELRGFGDTGEYSISLYTVTRSGNRSKPAEVVIQPLTPAVQSVGATLEAEQEYGGIAVSFTNEYANEFTLTTLIKDITGAWIEYDRFYTSSRGWTHLVRGLEPFPTEFAIFLTDKWRNNSDTLFTTITPLYEVEFDYSKFSLMRLDDDVYISTGGRDASVTWTRTHPFMIDLNQYSGLTFPHWFTVDTGNSYKFGRLRIQPRFGVSVLTFIYGRGALKAFEVWGSNTPSTNWDDWTLLGEFESIKPSGLPAGSTTAEDMQYVEDGWDFNFPRTDESYRYFRFKSLSSWGGTADVTFLYFQFWGEPQN